MTVEPALSHRCTVSLSSRDLLRGTSTAVLLSGFGKNMRGSAGGIGIASADDLYRESFPVSRLSVFLSHSWHAPWLPKYLTWLLYFNSTAAVCATLIAGSIAACLMHSHRDHAWQHLKDVHFICLPVGIFTFFVVLFSWHHIVSRIGLLRTSLFLDKVCIHQTDPVLKSNGIKSIGAFLNNTNLLVVAWDSTYFERLWCVYELAAFMYKRMRGNTIILPIRLGWVSSAMILLMLSTDLARLAALHVMGGTFLGLDEFTAWRLEFSLGFAAQLLFFTCVVRMYVRDVDELKVQLSKFSVQQAKCFCCSCNHILTVDGEVTHLSCDRLLVEASIAHWFGEDQKEIGLECFNRLVRMNLAKDIHDSLGGLSCIPYRFAMAIGIWNTLVFMDSLSTLDCDLWVKCAMTSLKIFTLNPITFAGASLLCQYYPLQPWLPCSPQTFCYRFVYSRFAELLISVSVCALDFIHAWTLDALLLKGSWISGLAILFDVLLTIVLFHKSGGEFLRLTVGGIMRPGAGISVSQSSGDVEMTSKIVQASP